MSLAMKPLLPPPPESYPPAASPEHPAHTPAPPAPPAQLARASTPAFDTSDTGGAKAATAETPKSDAPGAEVPAKEPFADAVRDVLASAEPSVAEAVREFVASQPPAEVQPPAGETNRPVVAVVTESAEPVYVSEQRDTVEAPPIPVEAAAPAVIDAAVDTTESVVVTLDEPAIGDNAVIVVESVADDQSVLDDKAVVIDKPALDDTVAADRGIAPIRVPTRSTEFVALRAITSRKLMIGAVSVAVVSVCVAGAAIMWARGAVTDAEHARDTAPVAPIAKPIDTSVARSVDDKVVVPVAPSTTANQPAPTTTCSVTVRSSNDDATVWVDGISRGSAPQTIKGTCDTTAVVEVRHPRYADFKRELVLVGDVEIDARLEREQTELTVWSEPPGAMVTYDGRDIGRTPLTTSVNRFEQGHIYFRAPGYETDWRRIIPKQAKKTVSITLQRSR